jgi:hypothetical protein
MGSMSQVRAAQLRYRDLMTEVAEVRGVTQAAGTKPSPRSGKGARVAAYRAVAVVALAVASLARP